MTKLHQNGATRRVTALCMTFPALSLSHSPASCKLLVKKKKKRCTTTSKGQRNIIGKAVLAFVQLLIYFTSKTFSSFRASIQISTVCFPHIFCCRNVLTFHLLQDRAAMVRPSDSGKEQSSAPRLPLTLSHFHKWIYYFQALTCPPPRQDVCASTQPTNYCQSWPWEAFRPITDPVRGS